MNEIYVQFMSIIHGIWRNRIIALGVAWFISIVGWFFISQIPNQYQSRAELHFDTDRVLTPLMSDLTLDNTIYSQVIMMRETLFGRENVEKVIQTTNIKNLVNPSGNLSDAELDYMVNEIIGKFLIEPQSDTLFSMSYIDEDPILAHGVVQGFLDAFMGGQLVDNAGELSGALTFIDEQLLDQESKLREAEQRRANFVQNNMSFLSSTGQTYYQSLNAARQEVLDVDLELEEMNSQKQQIIEYRDDLPPFVTSVNQNALVGAQRVTIQSRISAMVSQLDELYIRGYKQKHPDVVILKAQIASLEEQLTQENIVKEQALVDRDSAALSNMEGLIPNPLLNDLSIKLLDVEGEIAKLEARKVQKEAVVTNLLNLANRVPEVEAEEARLNRDYDIILENYNALLVKREEARMSQVLESQTLGINYSLITPAEIPSRPTSPDRFSLIMLTVFAGLVIGSAIALIMSLFKSTFSTEQSLRDVYNLPVLGSVSVILTPSELRKRRYKMIATGALFGGLIMASMFVYITLESINSSIV